ncbi:MAG: hypothetical protein JWN13_6191 [Betaproteobacteria bacterium]|jgi:hypothetical protein|nr:hypothetical protein [Betaproteobacteria bacterium]MEA3155675.1 hypothetical protein [Betaproteobacteria bacterium]
MGTIDRRTIIKTGGAHRRMRFYAAASAGRSPMRVAVAHDIVPAFA